MAIKSEHIDRAAELLLHQMGSASIPSVQLDAARIFVSLVEATNGSAGRAFSITLKPDAPTLFDE